MPRRRALSIVMLILALSVPYLDGASATVAGGGISLDPDVDSRIMASGTYAGQLVGTNQILVEFECNAVVVGVVASTSMECALYAGNGIHTAPPLASFGNVVATAGTAFVPFAPMRLCWRAQTQYVVGGGIASTSGCSVPYPTDLLPETDTEASGEPGGPGA
ncbi:MAG TPA: hypothetical protein VG318_11290 [Actinomycetota bacterium]|nr:hypothetical protein [Actinomycetota bacterium]